MSTRLLIISNRLPFSLKIKDKKIEFKESAGGLVTGISSYLESMKSSSFTTMEHIWIGWPGVAVDQKLEDKIEKKLSSDLNAYPVFLAEECMENFYHGFCNDTIWPLFHCFPTYVSYNEEYWASYKQVNNSFFETVKKLLKPGDIVWIHDYHLMLLPKLIREYMPDVLIGFFLHIPFPPYEIYRLLPKEWGAQILEGLLGCDLIGFHTNDYTQDYLRCVLRILGHEHDIGNIMVNDRVVRVDTFPMGIHFDKYLKTAESVEVHDISRELKGSLGETKVIVSVDRLDYTKGIKNRLEGYELFLEKNTEWHKKVILLLVVVPSRIGVKSYQRMKHTIDELVGRINGKFGDVAWTPIRYQYKYLPIDQLTAIYTTGDIALVTPLRDGMNLVAKEYLASRWDKTGVLILSEMAGAAKELGEAIIINPNHKKEIADALCTALEMPPEEQIARNTIMQERLKNYNVIRWADDFIQTLQTMSKHRREREAKLLTVDARVQLINKFREATSKLIFLDYDGTLVPFYKSPEEAKPDSELINLLGSFSESPNTKIVLISGRRRDFLQKWFGILNIEMVAEHGIWIKEHDGDWKLLKQLNVEWKDKLLPYFKRYVDRVPGSFIEEKEYSIAWHYRKADTELSSIRTKEFVDELITITSNTDLKIVQGNKVVEVRNYGVDKGSAASYFISNNKYDFILAIGDDETDEDLFKALPQDAVSIKVGISASYAKFNLKNHLDVRGLIKGMIK